MPARPPICGPCCFTCLIGTDPFDTDLSQWTTSGTVSVAGGLLVMAGASSAVFTPAPASVADGVWVQTFPQLSTDPATLRIEVCRLDANNNLFAELVRVGGALTLQLGQRSGGSDNYLTTAISAEDTGSEVEDRSAVEVCFEPGQTQEPQAVFVIGLPSAVSGGWSTPENALDFEGDNFAQYALPALNDVTDFLVLFNLNLGPAVPAGSTIDGVAWSVWHADQAPDNIIDFEVYLTTGTTVGDNKASLSFLGGSAPPALQQDYGGPTDDWNAGLTAEDVSSPLFGIALKYKNVGGDGSAVVVDYAICTLYFTTPERTPGVLTMKFTNSAAPNTAQCIRAINIDPGAGLGTGLLVMSGDWDFTQYEVQYHLSEARPTCPECCDVPDVICGCCDGLPASYSVDLGATGFGPEPVDGCDCTEITGTFVMDFQAQDRMVCQWRIDSESMECDGLAEASWSVGLNLRPGEEGFCFFQLTLAYTLPSGQIVMGHLFSEPFPEDECPEGEILLTAAFQTDFCDGVIPETVTIEAV